MNDVHEIGSDGYLAILRDARRWSDPDDPEHSTLIVAALRGDPDLGDLLVEVAGRLGPDDIDEISRLGVDLVDDWVVAVHWQHPEVLARFVDALESDEQLVGVLFSGASRSFGGLRTPEAARLTRVLDRWRPSSPRPPL